MKRRLMLIIDIFTFIFVVPFLIFIFATTGLIIGLAFNLDSYLAPTREASQPQRLRRYVYLPPVAPTSAQVPNAAPVINEPEPELPLAGVIEASPAATVPAEPTVVEAALPDTPNDDETATDSVPAEDTSLASETVLAEPSVLDAALPETATESESEPDSSSAAISAAVEDPNLAENTISPENDLLARADTLAVDETPLETVSSEATSPDTAADAEPFQDNTPAQPAPTVPPFVPDSSYFDKLLNQVKEPASQ